MQHSEKETEKQITWLGEVLYDLTNISGSLDFIADAAFEIDHNALGGIANLLTIVSAAMSRALDDVSSIHQNLCFPEAA